MARRLAWVRVRVRVRVGVGVRVTLTPTLTLTLTLTPPKKDPWTPVRAYDEEG